MLGALLFGIRRWLARSSVMALLPIHGLVTLNVGRPAVIEADFDGPAPRRD